MYSALKSASKSSIDVRLKKCTPFHHTIYDFSKKNLTQKISITLRAGKKQRPDFDSVQKTTLAMIYFIP